MWVQIMNAAEWLLFILLIFNGIPIYRKLKHKEKIPRKYLDKKKMFAEINLNNNHHGK